MSTNLDQIADGIYRISTWVPDVAPLRASPSTPHRRRGVTPAPRAMFADVSDAVARLVLVQRLRWIAGSGDAPGSPLTPTVSQSACHLTRGKPPWLPVFLVGECSLAANPTETPHDVSDLRQPTAVVDQQNPWPGAVPR
jgi:hypothetical protein